MRGPYFEELPRLSIRTYRPTISDLLNQTIPSGIPFDRVKYLQLSVDFCNKNFEPDLNTAHVVLDRREGAKKKLTEFVRRFTKLKDLELRIKLDEASAFTYSRDRLSEERRSFMHRHGRSIRNGSSALNRFSLRLFREIRDDIWLDCVYTMVRRRSSWILEDFTTCKGSVRRKHSDSHTVN